MLIFILISAIYIICLALVDGLFNQLVFREHASEPIDSEVKQRIYTLPEWKGIGIVLLAILPAILPTIALLILSDLEHLLVYWIVLLVVQWDMIFGKVVFHDWWGDIPSICLPIIGWQRYPLWLMTLLRLGAALLLGGVYIKLIG